MDRIVHVSITNPSEDSPFPYFRGKARVEHIIRESGLGYTLVRPTVVFGAEDILINNIAYEFGSRAMRAPVASMIRTKAGHTCGVEPRGDDCRHPRHCRR